MALEKIVRYSEKNIEDWMWENPEMITFVDGWLERQLTLNNEGRIDLLGYKRHGRLGTRLVLAELKSNPMEIKDLIQVVRYSYHLSDTLSSMIPSGITPEISKVLIGDGRRMSDDFLETANALGVLVYTVEINDRDDLELSGRWRFNENYYSEKIEKTCRIQERGHYSNLIKFCILSGRETLEGIINDES